MELNNEETHDINEIFLLFKDNIFKQILDFEEEYSCTILAKDQHPSKGHPNVDLFLVLLKKPNI